MCFGYSRSADFCIIESIECDLRGIGMNAMVKAVGAEWIHIEDMNPDKKVMCLCADGKIRFGTPICGDGYFYVENRVGWEIVKFWQEIPSLKNVQEEYWSQK